MSRPRKLHEFQQKQVYVAKTAACRDVLSEDDDDDVGYQTPESLN